MNGIYISILILTNTIPIAKKQDVKITRLIEVDTKGNRCFTCKGKDV
jgi:hypothetical protein